MLSFFLKVFDQLNEYPPIVKWLTIISIVSVFLLILSLIIIPKKNGHIDFSYIKVFSVKVDKDMYQLGAIIEISNFTTKPLDITNINYIGNKIELITRGSYNIPLRNGRFVPMLFTNKEIGHELVGKTPLLQDKTDRYKFLLPIKQDLIVKHGPLFEIIFWGNWEVVDSNKGKWIIKPRSIGNYNQIITLDEWKNISNPKIELKKNPNVTFRDDDVENYILFNSDRTAKLDLYGYCKTGYKRSETGTLVVIRGPKEPVLPDNWIVLATNYKQLWKNPKNLSLYNSVHPPENNHPVAFAKFAGVLLGAYPEGSTTTRCTDKFLIDVKKTIANQIPE